MKTIKEELAIARNKGKSGSSVRTAIIKATRSELLVSKKKHVDFLINTTKSGKPNTHALLTGLRSRAQTPDWQVALKALTVTHRMLREAHHSFVVACSRTGITMADNFTDVDNPEGAMQSEWIRVYGRYLEHKLKIVRKFDCQLELEPEKLMDYEYEQLFNALKAMLVQLKYILEFDKRMGLLTNQITLASFSLVLRDSINLYGALMQGFLRVTDEYTEMSKSEVEDAADLYEKFIDASVELIDKFYPKCKRYTSKLPDFDPAPEAMLKELDRYAKEAPLQPPEGRKARLMARRDNERDKRGSDRSGRRDEDISKSPRVRQIDAAAMSSGGSRSSASGRNGSGAGRGPTAAATGSSSSSSSRQRDVTRRTSRKQRNSDHELSFEDIPKEWLNPIAASVSPSSGIGYNNKSDRVRSTRTKGKEEYDYSDEVSRSDDEGEREETMIDMAAAQRQQQSRQSRPPPPSQPVQPPQNAALGQSFFSSPPPQQNQHLHQHQQHQQQQQQPSFFQSPPPQQQQQQQQPSFFASPPPQQQPQQSMFFPPQQQPQPQLQPQQSFGSFDPFSPSASALPQNALFAQPVSSSSSSMFFVPQQPQQSPQPQPQQQQFQQSPFGGPTAFVADPFSPAGVQQLQYQQQQQQQQLQMQQQQQQQQQRSNVNSASINTQHFSTQPTPPAFRAGSPFETQLPPVALKGVDYGPNVLSTEFDPFRVVNL